MERILDDLCGAPSGNNALPHVPGSPAAENFKARQARLAPEEQSEEDFAGQTFQYGFCLGTSPLLEVLEGRERRLR